jgi:hypothetical protein
VEKLAYEFDRYCHSIYPPYFTPKSGLVILSPWCHMETCPLLLFTGVCQYSP